MDNIVTFDTYHNFTNLQMDTVYLFAIFGTNLAGKGDAAVKMVRTSRINGK